jgi:hypothetical protein
VECDATENTVMEPKMQKMTVLDQDSINHNACVAACRKADDINSTFVA